MSITNCYRSRLPFRTKDAEWENYCLSFKEGDYLRVILTEKITTHTNNNNTNNVPPCHWCIAQDEEGGVGLAPLYALYKTQETSEKMASTVTSLWDTLLADYVPKTQQRAGTNIVKKEAMKIVNRDARREKRGTCVYRDPMEMMYNNTNNEQNNRLYNKYKEDEDDSSESEKEAMFGRRKTATALRFYDDNDDDSDASFFRDVEVSDEEGEDEDEDTIFLEKSSRGPKKNSVVVKENNFLTRQRTRAYNAETSEEDYAMHEISDVSQHGGTVPFDVALSAEYAHRDRFSITSPLHTKGTPSRQKGNNSESGELEDLEEGIVARHDCHRSRSPSPRKGNLNLSPENTNRRKGAATLIDKRRQRGNLIAEATRKGTELSKVAHLAETIMDACYDKIATHSRDGVDDDMLELLKQFVRITLENAWLTEKIVSVEHKIENKQELQQANRKGKEEEPFGAPLGTKGKQGEQKKAEQLEEAKQLLYSLQHGDGTTSIEDVLRNNEKDVKLIEGLTPFKERHVNRQLSKENEFTVLKHAAEEAQLTELLKDEVETWKDYVRQEKKLKKRWERVKHLQEALKEESDSLATSENAIRQVLPEEWYEVRENPDWREETDDGATDVKKQQPSPYCIYITNPSFQWPEHLDGLTEEEEAALRNYVRLFNKFEAKRKSLPPSQGTGGEQGSEEEREILRQGDMQRNLLLQEMQKMKSFVAQYGQTAKKIDEQIVLGNKLLAEKMEKVAQLQNR